VLRTLTPREERSSDALWSGDGSEHTLEEVASRLQSLASAFVKSKRGLRKLAASVEIRRKLRAFGCVRD